MATKFSDFTAQAATGTTFVVGYDGTTNAQYSQNDMTNFVLDGTLSSARTLKLDGNDLTINAGTSVYPTLQIGDGITLFPNGQNSGAYPGKNSMIIRGTINFPYYGAATQGLNWSSYNTNVRAWGFSLYGGGGWTHNSGYSVIGPNFAWNSGAALTARLGIIGKGNTSATYGLRVQNSDGEDTFSVRDDKYTTVTINNTISNGFLIKNEATWTMLDAGDEASSSNSGQMRMYNNNNVRFYFKSSEGLMVADTGNNASSGASSVLTATSNTRGFLPPRNADPASNITTPVAGLVAYDTTDNELQFYNGTSWNSAGGGASIYTADGSINEDRVITVGLGTNNNTYTTSFESTKNNGTSTRNSSGNILQIKETYTGQIPVSYGQTRGAVIKLHATNSAGTENTESYIHSFIVNSGGSDYISQDQMGFRTNRAFVFKATDTSWPIYFAVAGGPSNNPRQMVYGPGNGGLLQLKAGNAKTTKITIADTSSHGTGNGYYRYIDGGNTGNLVLGRKLSGGSEEAYITMSGVGGYSGNIAVGVNQGTPVSTLHVTGSGATDATTSLLVENSNGNDLLSIKDNGDYAVKNTSGVDRLTINSDGSAGLSILKTQSYTIRNTAGGTINTLQANNNGCIETWYFGGFQKAQLSANSGQFGVSDAGITSGMLDASALITMRSTTKGLLPPRMTNTQRDAISSPTAGLMLYSSTDSKIQFYNGSAWTDAGGGGDNIYTADGTIASTTRTITTTGTSNIIFNLSSNSRFYINSLYVLPTGGITSPSGGYFQINSYSTRLQANYLLLYSSTYITGTTAGFVTVSGTTGTSHSINARLGVIGKSATSTTDYAFRVQDSAAADMLTVRDDGAFALGKSASPQGASAVTIGQLAETTVSNSIAIGYNAEAAGGIAIGQNADNNQSYSQCIGGSTSTAAQYQTVIGYDADGLSGADRSIAIGASAKAAAQGGIAIGVGANAQNHCIVLGRNVGVSGTPDNSVVFSTRGGNNITYSEADSFTWYNTSDTVPDLKFKPGSNSYWNSSSNFGFGNGNTSPTATVDIDGTFRLRSASNVNGKVLTADANGNGTWQDAAGGSGQNLLAITSITGSEGDQVEHDVKVYSNTTSNNFAAINFNSDETERYAKIVFTPTGTVAKVVFRALGKDVGGTGDTWLGLHSSSSQTASPAYGWFLVNADAEAGEYEHITAEWLLTGLTANQQITAYVMGIASSSGSVFYARELNTGAWNSTSDRTAFPATVEAYDISATITSNPSS